MLMQIVFFELAVILAFADGVGEQATHVKQAALFHVPVTPDLHFDVDLLPVCGLASDIEHAFFVFNQPFGEQLAVQDGQVGDRSMVGPQQDRVQQPDQQRLAVGFSEQPFEQIIVFRIQSLLQVPVLPSVYHSLLRAWRKQKKARAVR
ncbi:hypothetical protein OMP40_20445 [Cohnella rhizosphaerae]|uniref:Uncharacterized protein n=1 Tax=Cohnella rhizosphaerae TaxID=1457232 RepID=A0A9X4KV72_9BACL|nr:hypothetical protein [Cohnella rhizosphaerae]MDG0811475.1 hypothetical protein [Cohnella rhizosphaerae]